MMKIEILISKSKHLHTKECKTHIHYKLTGQSTKFVLHNFYFFFWHVKKSCSLVGQTKQINVSVISFSLCHFKCPSKSLLYVGLKSQGLALTDAFLAQMTQL